MGSFALYSVRKTKWYSYCSFTELCLKVYFFMQAVFRNDNLSSRKEVAGKFRCRSCNKVI